MKRCCLTAIVAVALAVVPTLAQASQEGSDKVVGGGVLPVAPVFDQGVTFNVSAFSDPDGTDSRGHIHFSDQGKPVKNKVFGEVQCVRVDENRATIIYTDKPGTTVSNGQGGVIFLEDNGPPQGGDPRDRLGNARLVLAEINDRVAKDCKPSPSVLGASPIDKGNIVIDDD